MWGDESEAVAPIIWLYQIVDAQKEGVFFPDLLITLRSYVPNTSVAKMTYRTNRMSLLIDSSLIIKDELLPFDCI